MLVYEARLGSTSLVSLGRLRCRGIEACSTKWEKGVVGVALGAHWRRIMPAVFYRGSSFPRYMLSPGGMLLCWHNFSLPLASICGWFLELSSAPPRPPSPYYIARPGPPAFFLLLTNSVWFRPGALPFCFGGRVVVLSTPGTVCDCAAVTIVPSVHGHRTAAM